MAFLPTRASAAAAFSDSDKPANATRQSARISERSRMEPSALDDILAAASSNANTNVSMMGETFKYCAPIAGALGFSAEDTAEAIGLESKSAAVFTAAVPSPATAPVTGRNFLPTEEILSPSACSFSPGLQNEVLCFGGSGGHELHGDGRVEDLGYALRD